MNSRKRLLVAVLLLIYGQSTPVAGNVDISKVAYGIMFDKELNKKNIEVLIAYCRNAGPGLKKDMPSQGSDVGVLAVYKYNLPIEKMYETIITAHKEKIYSSTIYEYNRDLDEKEMHEFISRQEGSLQYISHNKVYGKFKTRFAYSLQCDLLKSANWLIERESLAQKAKRIKGIAGYLNTLSYFTILVATADKQTLRIVGSWNDAGGKLPLIGKLRAKHKDVYEGVETGHQDIQRYFKLIK